MEAAAEHDDALAASDLANELDARLDGFPARVAEEDHVEVARRHRGERLGERDVRLVRRDAGADVRELRHLLLHGRDDAGVRMADRRHRDAGREVEDPAAIFGQEPAPLPAVDLQPGVMAKDRRKDPAGALLERCSHKVDSTGRHGNLDSRPEPSFAGVGTSVRFSHMAV